MGKLILLLLCLSACNTSAWAQQSGENKLAIKLIAQIQDYRGPSEARARRALLTFSPNGTWLAMSAKDRTVNVYFASDGKLFKTLKAGPLPQSEKEGIGAFSFSPNGLMAAARNFIDKTVQIWDTERWEPQKTLTGRKRNFETKSKAGGSQFFEDGFAPVPFSPDSRKLLVEREDDVVEIWDIAKGEEIATLNHETNMSGAKEVVKVLLFGGTRHFLFMQAGFSGDGRFVSTANGDKSPKIWDAATGKLLTTLKSPERLYRAVLNRDGSSVITLQLQGAVEVWDAESGAHRAVLEGKNFVEGDLNGFELSPDGEKMVTFLSEKTTIWDAQTGVKHVALPKVGKARDAVFSHDGRWLATASDSNKTALAVIWNVADGAAKTTLPGASDAAKTIHFSPDGKILATANDKGVKLWRVETGELLATLAEARPPLSFSADMTRLVTGARKNTALLWELPAPNKATEQASLNK
jgi:WD40 repeat protein